MREAKTTKSPDARAAAASLVNPVFLRSDGKRDIAADPADNLTRISLNVVSGAPFLAGFERGVC